MVGLTVGGTIRAMRDAIIRIAAKHGATQVRLIGSVARGESRDPGIRLPGCDHSLRSDADRVSDSLEAIEKFKARITDSIDVFERDELLQVWAIHYLQVIGDAARGVSQPLRDGHPRS